MLGYLSVRGRLNPEYCAEPLAPIWHWANESTFNFKGAKVTALEKGGLYAGLSDTSRATTPTFLLESADGTQRIRAYYSADGWVFDRVANDDFDPSKEMTEVDVVNSALEMLLSRGAIISMHMQLELLDAVERYLKEKRG